jgi:hypothetical protein
MYIEGIDNTALYKNQVKKVLRKFDRENPELSKQIKIQFTKTGRFESCAGIVGENTATGVCQPTMSDDGMACYTITMLVDKCAGDIMYLTAHELGHAKATNDCIVGGNKAAIECMNYDKHSKYAFEFAMLQEVRASQFGYKLISGICNEYIESEKERLMADMVGILSQISLHLVRDNIYMQLGGKQGFLYYLCEAIAANSEVFTSQNNNYMAKEAIYKVKDYACCILKAAKEIDKITLSDLETINQYIRRLPF